MSQTFRKSFLYYIFVLIFRLVSSSDDLHQVHYWHKPSLKNLLGPLPSVSLCHLSHCLLPSLMEDHKKWSPSSFPPLVIFCLKFQKNNVFDRTC